MISSTPLPLKRGGGVSASYREPVELLRQAVLFYYIHMG